MGEHYVYSEGQRFLVGQELLKRGILTFIRDRETIAILFGATLIPEQQYPTSSLISLMPSSPETHSATLVSIIQSLQDS